MAEKLRIRSYFTLTVQTSTKVTMECKYVIYQMVSKQCILYCATVDSFTSVA